MWWITIRENREKHIMRILKSRSYFLDIGSQHETMIPFQFYVPAICWKTVELQNKELALNKESTVPVHSINFGEIFLHHWNILIIHTYCHNQILLRAKMILWPALISTPVKAKSMVVNNSFWMAHFSQLPASISQYPMGGLRKCRYSVQQHIASGDPARLEPATFH